MRKTICMQMGEVGSGGSRATAEQCTAYDGSVWESVVVWQMEGGGREVVI